jgi:predicted nucleic-acid-binding Zn-ribbon protein
MPDYNGMLSPDDRKIIDVWIKNNWHMGTCPICRKQNWVLADHVVNPALYSGLGILQSGAYPQIMFICQVCGYTLYFNAGSVGIVRGNKNATY